MGYAFPVGSRGRETADKTLVDPSFAASRQTVPYAINKSPSTSRFGVSLMTVPPSSVTNRVENDALGRRTARNAERYGYDDRSELVSATKDGADGYAYLYDDVGNRLSSVEPDGTLEYIANNLNQYASVSNSASSVPPCEAFSPSFNAEGSQILVKTATRVWSVSYKTLMEGIQKGIGRIAGRISDMEYEFFLNMDCCDLGKVARSAGFLKPVKEALNRPKEHDNPTKGVK
ncbi:MAG: hypothetical protein ACI4R9_03485 [Kiritimatiellia bacterium]